MARIGVAAPALADFILAGEWDPAMPRSFILSEDRLVRLRSLVREANMPSAEGGSTAEVLRAKMEGSGVLHRSSRNPCRRIGTTA